MNFLSMIVILSVACGQEFQQQNTTSSSVRRSGQRDANILAALHQIQLQLGILEAESQRQTTTIQELGRITNRLEGQRQDLINSIDRSEARISQRLDDVKGDVQKVVALQEVIRDDLDKIQQNQLLNKIWLDEQMRQLHARPERNTSPPIDQSTILSSTDILSNMQILQTTLYSLRRMADTLQINLGTIRFNMTQLTNLTRQILDHQKEDIVSKSYLQSSLQVLQSETQESQPYTACYSALRSPEPEERLPRDCKEVQDHVQNRTGIYRIQPNYALRPIFVFCDMEIEGGGWTVIQRRQDGSVDFLREWNDYKHGFGNVGGEFWLGNENLYLITHQKLYEIRIDLADFEDGNAYSKYEGFAVGSEKEKYMLKLLGPLVAGDAGDGLTYHASIPFSTIDMDNDRWEGGNCAQDHTGGWWYNQCDACNLNGQYFGGLTNQEYKGVYWHEWQGPNYSLMRTQMMIRPMKHHTFPDLPITQDEPHEDSVPSTEMDKPDTTLYNTNTSMPGITYYFNTTYDP